MGVSSGVRGAHKRGGIDCVGDERLRIMGTEYTRTLLR